MNTTPPCQPFWRRELHAFDQLAISLWADKVAAERRVKALEERVAQLEAYFAPEVSASVELPIAQARIRELEANPLALARIAELEAENSQLKGRS